MPTPLNPRYEPYLAPMKSAAEVLKQQAWFTKDWRITAGPFQDGEGVWIGLWKTNWFNDDFCGIHFEGAIEWGGHNLRHVVCAMHVLHRPTFPGTDLGRDAFSEPFVKSPEVRRIIRSWKAGYKVKPGMVTFRLNRKFEEKGIVESVVEEFGRYHALAPEIDRILKEEVTSK